MSVCLSVNPVCATNQELNLTVLVSSLSVNANYYLSASFVQPIRSRILFVSSLSAYEHLYFDMELFESELPLQFLSYLSQMHILP